jgi:hypothetical protein
MLPYQRDAVRIGFINYTPPAGAGRWPETDFGWNILLGRFAEKRRIDALWTGAPVPVSMEETKARLSYEAWKRGEKIIDSTPEKVLTGVWEQVRHVFSGLLQTTRRLVRVYALSV